MELEELSSLEDGDFEEEEDDEDVAGPCYSLIGRETFDSLDAAVEADAEKFAFNFKTFILEARLDGIETIQCINYARSRERGGRTLVDLFKNGLYRDPRPWREDEFMRPVLEGDEYLLHDWNEDDMDTGEEKARAGGMRVDAAAAAADTAEALQHENAVLRCAVQELSRFLPHELTAELPQGSDLNGAGMVERLDRLGIEGPSTSGNSASPLLMAKRRGGPILPDTAFVDAQYFESYSHFGIHREMISDKIRTEAYRKALEGNPGLMHGATVLDIGCGTGILSLFAARGGASRVIGVEGSKTMAECAAAIAAANGLLDRNGGPVSVLAGRLEDIREFPVHKDGMQFDVIVSEWMGYCLLFEAMLDTVLLARDRWLRPGGAILPDVAKLFLAGGSSGSLGTTFWSDVYGFSMEPVAQQIWAASQSKAVVCEVPATEVLTGTAAIRSFDLATMRQEDTDFSTPFELVGGSQADRPCAALVLWFDVDFSVRFCAHQPVVLSTSPFTTQTHWAQTVLPLREPVVLGPGGLLAGRISLARSKEHRSLDISVEYQTPGREKGAMETCALSYRVAMS